MKDAIGSICKLRFTKTYEDNRVEALSIWDRKDSYEKYFQWRIDSGAFEEIGTLVVDDRVLRLLDLRVSYTSTSGPFF